MDSVAQKVAARYSPGLDRVAQKVASRFKEAAEEITLDELPDDRKAFIAKLERVFGQASMAWEGVHGVVVDFEPKMGMTHRFNRADMKMLLSDPNFRWVEGDRASISVGM